MLLVHKKYINSPMLYGEVSQFSISMITTFAAAGGRRKVPSSTRSSQARMLLRNWCSVSRALPGNRVYRLGRIQLHSTSLAGNMCPPGSQCDRRGSRRWQWFRWDATRAEPQYWLVSFRMLHSWPCCCSAAQWVDFDALRLYIVHLLSDSLS